MTLSAVRPQQNMTQLDTVLMRLAQAGLQLKRCKLRFAVEQVVYLGYIIDTAGIHPTEEKLKATKEMPEPTCQTMLQSFLRLLAFFERFLANRATITKDLYIFLEKDVPGEWQETNWRAFRQLKYVIAQRAVLAHYDKNKSLSVSCDATLYGIEAVLAQLDSDRNKTPIVFTSRMLIKVEKDFF